MNPTYRQLADAINKMSDEWKDTNVTVYLAESDEYIPVNAITEADETEDVLDTGHPILLIDA